MMKRMLRGKEISSTCPHLFMALIQIPQKIKLDKKFIKKAYISFLICASKKALKQCSHIILHSAGHKQIKLKKNKKRRKQAYV